jgi:hypothetical protein
MQWWDRAADILTRADTRLRRFGFVTTNSITQVFSRRVIERHLEKIFPGTARGAGEAGEGGQPEIPQQEAPAGAASVMPDQRVSSAPHCSAMSGGHGDPLMAGISGRKSAGPPPAQTPAEVPAFAGTTTALSLVLAIPDHPWTRATRDAAAVRIAMTVAQAGAHAGRLVEIVREAKLDTDEPELEDRETIGRINADLTVGTDVTGLRPLLANEGICSPGVKLHGAGFIVTPVKAEELGLGKREGLGLHIRPYLNGRDLLQRPRGVMVVDLFELTERDVRLRFPEVYQHIMMHVKPDRDTNRRDYRRLNWWVFGENNPLLRQALEQLQRFIGTTETSKHRLFQFIRGDTLPDNMITAIGSDDAFHHGVLSSSIHVGWALHAGGTLEDRPRYSKSKIFDPFPFPDPAAEQRAAIAEIAEELDSTRRTALAENDKLTMTGLYNLVEAVRTGTLPADQEAQTTRARARIVAKLHDDLDAAVAAAYGWPADLPPAEIVSRLVALNAERAAEEAAGHVRWLRPDYQQSRFGKAV